jgi:hypothetical protein
MTISALGRSLIDALPPAFILLVLINAGFIGMVLWFLSAQMEQRMALANRVLDHCLAAH